MPKYYSRDEYTKERMVDWLQDFADEQGTKHGAPEPQKDAGFMDRMRAIVNHNKESTVEAKVEQYRQMVGLGLVDSLEKAGENEPTSKEAAKKIEVGSVWEANELPGLFARVLASDGHEVKVLEVDKTGLGYFREGITESERTYRRIEFLNQYEYWGAPGTELPSKEDQLISDHNNGKHQDFLNCPKCQAQSKQASRASLSIRDKTAQQQDDKQLMTNIKEFVTDVIQNRNGAVATPALFDQIEDYLKVNKEWLRNNFDDVNTIIEKARKQFHPKTYNDVSVHDLTRTDDPMKDKEPPPIVTQTNPAS